MTPRLFLAFVLSLCLAGSAFATECGISLRRNCETDECAGRQVLGCEPCGFMCERCKCGDPLPDSATQTPVVDKKAECLNTCRTARAERNKKCPPGDYHDMTRQACLEGSKNDFDDCTRKCDK